MGETKKGSERPPKKGTHAAEAGDRGRRQEAHVVEHGLLGAPGEAVGGGRDDEQSDEEPAGTGWGLEGEGGHRSQLRVPQHGLELAGQCRCY